MNTRLFDFLTLLVAPGENADLSVFCHSWLNPSTPTMVAAAPSINFAVTAGPTFDAGTGAVMMTVRNDEAVPARFAAILTIDTDEAAAEDTAARDTYLRSTWPPLH